MKIAHVSDFYLPRLGGVELHISDLAAQQATRGHDVTVVTASPSADPDSLEAGVRVVRVTQRLRRGRLLTPRAPLAGVRVLLEGQFELVHAHVGLGTPLAFWAALRCARAGIPTVATVHSLWAWAHPLFRLLNALLGFSRQPIVWTAVSGVAADQVRRVLGASTTVSVLPNGIDPASWRRTRLPHAADEVLVLAVMRLAARKRPVPLLRLLRTARQQLPAGVRLQAVVVGDGPQRPATEAYVARHAMTDWICLPGQQTREQIRELYRRADVFLAPADLESFGIAALEARCAGVPVIAKAATGIADFVEHGRTGLLVHSDHAMATALVQLCRAPRERAAMARTAREQPIGVTWTATLALTDAAYDEARRRSGSVVQAATRTHARPAGRAPDAPASSRQLEQPAVPSDGATRLPLRVALQGHLGGLGLEPGVTDRPSRRTRRGRLRLAVLLYVTCVVDLVRHVRSSASWSLNRW